MYVAVLRGIGYWVLGIGYWVLGTGKNSSPIPNLQFPIRFTVIYAISPQAGYTRYLRLFCFKT
ncbi:hypothetical protein [Iningainema tapete]|uniref:Uncharacterized protein n=1 Tax=Iningainema tapete BLCC-T55 TaxID=2748662 RepID=A0A8J6XMA9_9CYAN|nr:hypothetical protein [Iningainema tapete]MBD2775511.1 hypothetical protein [Iningainema tapete BLCC-T55]